MPISGTRPLKTHLKKNIKSCQESGDIEGLQWSPLGKEKEGITQHSGDATMQVRSQVVAKVVQIACNHAHKQGVIGGQPEQKWQEQEQCPVSTK